MKRLESFLEDLSSSTIELRLGLQMHRLLKLYRGRKAREQAYQEKV